MTFEDITKIYKRVQEERAKDLSLESLSLSAFIWDGIPTVPTEVRPGLKVFGIPVHVSEHMPEKMGMAVTRCMCTALERMQPNHVGKHVVILDFRSEEEKQG